MFLSNTRRRSRTINELLRTSLDESPTTRVSQIRVDDKFIDDGSIKEIGVEAVSSGETPRRALQKRYKSAELPSKQ